MHVGMSATRLSPRDPWLCVPTLRRVCPFFSAISVALASQRYCDGGSNCKWPALTGTER